MKQGANRKANWAEQGPTGTGRPSCPTLALLGVPLSQSKAGATAILVDELNASAAEAG